MKKGFEIKFYYFYVGIVAATLGFCPESIVFFRCVRPVKCLNGGENHFLQSGIFPLTRV